MQSHGRAISSFSSQVLQGLIAVATLCLASSAHGALIVGPGDSSSDLAVENLLQDSHSASDAFRFRSDSQTESMSPRRAAVKGSCGSYLLEPQLSDSNFGSTNAYGVVELLPDLGWPEWLSHAARKHVRMETGSTMQPPVNAGQVNGAGSVYYESHVITNELRLIRLVSSEVSGAIPPNPSSRFFRPPRECEIA